MINFNVEEVRIVMFSSFLISQIFSSLIFFKALNRNTAILILPSFQTSMEKLMRDMTSYISRLT